jgi:uncharacterized protein
MAKNFGSVLFTDVIQRLQEKHGSRRQYARLTESAGVPDSLSPREAEFIAERDSFYMASISASGWPYIQHRGGPQGFLKVVDPHMLAFADFLGNKQYISTGNLMTNDRVALFLMNYPEQTRLKILGHVEILEGDAATGWIARLSDPRYKAAVERVFLIRVEAYDWNCPQHITRRYSEEEIAEALQPVERKLRELERENESLRLELAKHRGNAAEAAETR